MATIINRTTKVIALQNHMIDFADNPKEKMTADYGLLKYEVLTCALDDIFDLNKTLMGDLEKVEVYLMKILDEQHGQKEQADQEEAEEY